MTATSIPPNVIVIMRCTVCQFESICTNGLCLDCQDMKHQSELARAMCAYIHRDSPARRADADAR